MGLFRGIQLSGALEPAKNNFDLLRICAAIAVLFGHSYWIQPAENPEEPILRFTELEYSGSLAVFAFFLISGILVSASFERQKSLERFMILRLTRIYPALVFCIIATTYVVYPAFSEVSFLNALFSQSSMTYLLTNIGLFFKTQWDLPGLFEMNPVKGFVNGSLWTLPLELKCYMLVVAAGLCSCFTSKYRFVAFCTLIGVAFSYLVIHGSNIAFFESLTLRPIGYSFHPLVFFCAGMILYVFRNNISVNWAVGIALSLAYLAMKTTPLGSVLFYLAFVYVLLLIAVEPALLRFRPKHDYSYGVYLWGFLVQQVVASHYPHMNNLISLTISVPVTVGVAAISWHLVEKPSLYSVKKLLQIKPREVMSQG